MKHILIITSAIFFLTQCKTADYATPYNYEGRSISFGNGGGFTGRVLDFTLMDNGQIFKGANKEGNVTMVRKIPREQADQIFSNYDVLGFGDQTVSSPGNMYYYVEMWDNDHSHKLVWGNHDAGESKELRVYHANLMSLVTKMTKPMPTKFEMK